jgi:putative SOS response-associated peptidase YedK
VCGRYANGRTAAELAETFAAEPDEAAQSLEPAFNVAPTDPVAAVLTRRPRAEGSEGGGRGEPSRRLTVLRWGLVPSWAKDRKIAARLINARLETVAEKPAFRRAFATRRCLLPADGYYEWTAPESGGKGPKQPWLLRPGDGSVLALAGLYEIWRDPADGDAPLLWTSTVITTEAVDEAGRVHDRMPMLVEPQAWSAWLDPDVDDPDALRGVLRPAAAGRLEVVPVSTAVNDVRADGPELVRPLPARDPRRAGPDASPPPAVRLQDPPALF